LSQPQKIPLATNVGHSKPKNIEREVLENHADNLSNAHWSLGYVSTIDSNG
jgi:hypothetical protein